MSDNNEKQLPVPSRDSANSAARPRLWPLWLLVLVLIAAVATLGFTLWEQHQEQAHNQQQVADRLTALEEETEQLKGEQQSLRQGREDRLNRLESKLDEHGSRLETQSRQIDHNARSLLGLGQRTRTDWLLAEAEYLLRLANQRLQLEGDFRGALAILEDVDRVLAETDDAGTHPVRRQLAEDILALRTITPVDRTGIYLQLEAGMGMANELTGGHLHQARMSAPAPQERREELAETEGLSWERAWQQVRDTLGEIVVIRRLDDPARPLLSPEQESQARLHLQMMMEEAGVALLRQDKVTYKRALRRAREWLNEWYDPQRSEVQTLDELLKELSEREIAPPRPDISESLSLLKARIAGRLDEGNNEGDNNGENDS